MVDSETKDEITANLAKQAEINRSRLPPSLQANPNIPFENQTLEQLRAERDHWIAMTATAPGFASAKAADDFRRGCEVWIKLRELGHK